MDIKVRVAKKDDAFELSELFVEFIGTRSNIEKIQYQLDLLHKQPNYYVAVACLEEKVVGTAMGIVCPDIVGECQPYLLVENVVVSSVYQGSGIGKKLMNALEDFAMENLCSYIILASSKNREQAHRFYESIGYEGTKRGFIKRI
ncbi:GNAT family N-acetyltransferase [Paenibacillus glucanolyticus]|uniref:GNAT family N-acetyltransferase n=1 Tax=Paenibacillus glucanolyticus TaxID=59843 RepID=UPI00096D0032|nr:GNAT family N-acetyltransferase [Paenibacillus glucanolyticus]OMF80274.1 GNAT family N-acetyltransferase [Paenibacillus glucanolyticus]